MNCVDINVLVYAHRVESPHHAEYRSWLEEACDGDEPLGLPDLTLSGFIRIVTHRKIYREPTTLGDALAFIAELRAGDACLTIASGDRHWSLFEGLCRRIEATGNDIPDAFLAAIAIESGATLITADRGFGRFPGLRWRHPLDSA